jgi:N-acetylglucosamine kinase-like BadF-type ATPase
MTMQPSQYVLAADGGNSKTIVLAVRFDGTIAGAGRAGCGDIRVGDDMQPALDALDCARQAALAAAGLPALSAAAAACAFSMAGADWPEDAADFRARLISLGYPEKTAVVNDGAGAVYAACPEGFGVAVAAGTYAATGARSRDGTRQWHSGFWQKGGGATGLGGCAIERVYLAEMGMSAPTVLTGKVLSHFAMASAEDLLHAFTSRRVPPPKGAAQLARVVLDCARDGDRAALDIVRQEAALMCGTAVFAARKTGFEGGGAPFPLAFLGGVFRHPFRLLGDLIAAGFQRHYPQARLSYSAAQPIEGAALLALARAGVTVDRQIRARISASLPPDSFFAT